MSQLARATGKARKIIGIRLWRIEEARPFVAMGTEAYASSGSRLQVIDGPLPGIAR